MKLEWKRIPRNGFIQAHQIAIGTRGIEYSIWQRRPTKYERRATTTLRIGRSGSCTCVDTADAKMQAQFHEDHPS
jgi:hypothetical protein